MNVALTLFLAGSALWALLGLLHLLDYYLSKEKQK